MRVKPRHAANLCGVPYAEFLYAMGALGIRTLNRGIDDEEGRGA